MGATDKHASDDNSRIILSPDSFPTGATASQTQGVETVGSAPIGKVAQTGGIYEATPNTVDDGNVAVDHYDSSQNHKTTMASQLDEVNDSMSCYEKGWDTVNLTASGQILAGAGTIKGFFVNSTSSGTVRIADNTAAGSGYLGAAITPAAGAFYEYPAEVSTGGYITIANTIDVTFLVRLGAQK